MPGKNRPSQQRYPSRDRQRRSRWRRAGREATAWCVICDWPCLNAAGLHIHESRMHG